MQQKLLISCAAAALAASLGTAAWAGNTGGASQSQANSSAPPAKRGDEASAREAHRNQAQSPEGYVLLEEDTVYLMANEPQQHFLQAHADLARKDDRGAAEETRLAAAYLDMQAARHGVAQGSSLKQQADHLRHMAGELEQGKANVPVGHLDRDFARASDALARHFDSLAKWDLQKQRFIAAGYDLGATATSLQNTIVWSNEKPSQEDLTMIGNAEEIGTNLRNNEVYQGEKALKAEKETSSKDANSKSGQDKAGEAQTANARLPAGVTNSPLTGTTPAEARNDAEHARKMVDALGEAIDKCGKMIDQNKSEPAEKGDSPTQKENASNPNQQEGNSQKSR